MSDNVYTALAKAQAHMGRAIKGSTNPHFRSKYAQLSDVMHACLPALNEQGLALWHSMPEPSIMRSTLSHGVSDTHLTCDVPLIVDKNNMQGMKSATTYAKRIGVESVCGISPSDDDDGNGAVAAKPKEPAKTQQTPPPKPKVDPDKIATLFRKATDLGWKTDEMKKILEERVGAKSTNDLTEEQFESFRNHLLQEPIPDES